MVLLQTGLALAYAGTVLYSILVIEQTPLALLYTQHPIGVTLFIFFSTVGLAQAQRIRGELAASKKAAEPVVTNHAICNWLALFSLVAAQLAIYQTKENNKKPHLATTHGMMGAATVGVFLLNIVGGVAINTVPKLYKYVKFHRLQGYLIYLSMVATHASAVWLGYAGFKTAPVPKYCLLGLLGAMALLALSKAKASMLLPGKARGKAKKA